MKKTRNQFPPKWHEVYPQGTKAGGEEQKFFRALARHPKWDWRSVASIEAETGLSKQRIEQIINKYCSLDPPLVLQNPANEDQWGYWELHRKLLKPKEETISESDTKKRLKKILDDIS